jgi:hypothetical protein
LRKICFLMLAALALLLNQMPIAVAQNPVALSPQHEWVAGVADEAFQHAEQAWAVCIRRAPGRNERQQNSDWVDEVVMHCAKELTHALDVKSLGYRARRPSAFAPWRSAEPAGSLGRQGASSWKTRFATVGFHRLAHQEQKGHERRTPCRPGGERDHHAPSRVRSKKSLIGISARAISSAIAASGNRPCSSTNSRQYSSKVFGRTISSMSSAVVFGRS